MHQFGVLCTVFFCPSCAEATRQTNCCSRFHLFLALLFPPFRSEQNLAPSATLVSRVNVYLCFTHCPDTQATNRHQWQTFNTLPTIHRPAAFDNSTVQLALRTNNMASRRIESNRATPLATRICFLSATTTTSSYCYLSIATIGHFW